GEMPWVDMTLWWLARMGVAVENTEYRRYRVTGSRGFAPLEYTVPRDWSAALYPIVAGVLTPDSEVRVSGMDMDDCQGDKGVVDVLISMGADITVEGDTVIARSSMLTGREIDCNDFIDQLPLLAVVGAAAEGETVLTNAAICRQKECDRIAASCETLSAMGAEIEERESGLVVRKSSLRGAELSSYHDHRMVMSMAVAALGAKGTTTITDIECVKKTFPRFVEELAKIGCDFQKETP
ncbi:MAG: 3-phosphoshikimate 1-carboxyvinyltransferase, partial [Phycisphaerales bacterium]|nr:3-phosphoshikimate 1-carboxyvinyltransferase [Phycisphaerales bacterium]